jgi:hypothetical protein
VEHAERNAVYGNDAKGLESSPHSPHPDTVLSCEKMWVDQVLYPTAVRICAVLSRMRTFRHPDVVSLEFIGTSDGQHWALFDRRVR